MSDKVFEKLVSVNVNGHTEKKQGLTYLTWSWAWDEVKRRYPDASYTIWKNEQGLPYVFDEKTGYMVYTTVTIEGITHEMWLPVMDGANKAMKDKPYKYKVKDWKTKELVEKTCLEASMFDINKTIMRCLVKNLAMFGLGLYIYAGEDLPTVDEDEQKSKDEINAEAVERANCLKFITDRAKDIDLAKLCMMLKVQNITDASTSKLKNAVDNWAQVEEKCGISR